MRIRQVVRAALPLLFWLGASCGAQSIDPFYAGSYSITTLPIAVEGTFRIDVWKDEFTDTVMAIYHLDGEAVR